MKVAIIGSENIDGKTFATVQQIARACARRGFELNTGSCRGADYAAMLGFREVDPTKVNLFLPWASYEKQYHAPTDNITVYNPYEHKEWADMARRYHPTPDKLTQTTIRFHARNCAIVNGVDLVIAFPLPDNFGSWGGTGQGMRIAIGNKIPMFNCYHEKDLKKLCEHLKTLPILTR